LALRLFRFGLSALTLDPELFGTPLLLLVPQLIVQLDLQFLPPGIFVAYEKSIPQKVICFRGGKQ